MYAYCITQILFWGACFKKEVLQSTRHGWDVLAVLGFFVLIPSLGGIGLAPMPLILLRVGPLLILISASLAMMFSLDTLFSEDEKSGLLDMLRLARGGFITFFSAKAMAYWVRFGVILSLFSFLDSLLLQLSAKVAVIQFFMLLLMTLFLSFLGVFSSALVLGARLKGVLIVLLVLPLSLPAFILGVWIGMQALAQDSPLFGFLMLGALDCVALFAFPLLGAWCLSIDKQ